MKIKYKRIDERLPKTINKYGVIFEEGKPVEVDNPDFWLEYPYFEKVSAGRPKKVKADGADNSSSSDKNTGKAKGS